MLGVYFDGHRDNRRFLLPDDLADIPPLRKVFAILGRYYLNVRIFDYLHNLEPGHSGEIQLTDALSKMLSDDQFIVIESGDYHFDVGNLMGLELAERYINNNPF